MVHGVEENTSLQTALRAIGDRFTILTDELRTSNRLTDRAADARLEAGALLARIASVLERQAGELDEVTRTHVKSLDLVVGRLIEDAARGRDQAVAEIRDEIRLLARTLSVIGDRER